MFHAAPNHTQGNGELDFHCDGVAVTSFVSSRFRADAFCCVGLGHVGSMDAACLVVMLLLANVDVD